MFDGVAEEWAAVRLLDLIASLDAGVSVNSQGRRCNDDEVGVLKTSSVNGGRFNPAEHKAIVTGERVRARVPVKADSIILSRMNTPDLVGENAFVEIDYPSLYLPDRLWLLRTNNRAECRWLSFYMQSKLFRSQLIDIATGTSGSMKNISKARLLELSLLLPPLDEQRRIAEVLRSVDEAVAAQVEVCRHLARTFNYLAEASFVQPHGQVLGAWTVLPMGEICESIQVGIVVRPASYYVPNGGIPALRSLNIGENYLNLDDLVYISEEGHRLNGKSSLRAGDIVTRRTGEPGKTAMIPACFPDGLNCIDIIFSRPKAIVRAEFVSFFMNSDAAKKQVIALQGGLAQQHINVTEMKTLKVPVPPLDVQGEIITALRSAMANLERERALIDQWSCLQAALMSDLLSGRVRVPA